MTGARGATPPPGAAIAAMPHDRTATASQATTRSTSTTSSSATIAADANEAGIEFREVSKRYDAAPDAPPAVDAISFRVPRGTLTAILGPSGSGKTTTLRMIAGLEAPSAGTILIDGREVTRASPAERDVSMVFQSYALFPHMSVLANVGYGLDVSGVPKAEALARARAAIANAGLDGLEARRPSELSGGQQQRVALARALVLEPAVLLFDEPLSNLDARLRRAMREEIRALQQRLGLTVAYVTHDQAEAMAVSDAIVVMERGRIAQAGTPAELYERPRSAFVAGFMGEAMLFDGTAQADGSVRLGPLAWRPAEPVAPGPVKVAVRPSAWQVRRRESERPGDVELAGAGAGAGAGNGNGNGNGDDDRNRNRNSDSNRDRGSDSNGDAGLAGTVAKSAYLGSLHELTVDSALGPVFATLPADGAEWPVGLPVRLQLAGHGVSVLPRD